MTQKAINISYLASKNGVLILKYSIKKRYNGSENGKLSCLHGLKTFFVKKTTNLWDKGLHFF